ncbi:MAG: AAA family ATPase [Cloacibacillus porcorum]|uniref:AAA family ATPase n=1 Tax=Cloacibacillus porcorum TaxID=1197717 RepID=UPI0023F1436F|nr:AAA family ATPase [Cloacibacillus porcorum]MCD7876152.1 AAA family ATPase [Cloacibacillus porcorum]
MKNVFFIGGTMGAGKTAVCQVLKKRLDRSVFLDGDWCWDMEPFQVTEETKALALDSVCYLLGNFIRCSAYENVIFCWVMHRQEIIDSILARLDTSGCRLNIFSLVCGEEALRRRLEGDIRAGKRAPDIIERSLEYLPLYERLDTLKIDVSELTPEKVAELIVQMSGENLPRQFNIQ